MLLKAIVTATALAASLTPALAGSGGCGHNDRQAQVSCADGKTWDAATQSCITVGS